MSDGLSIFGALVRSLAWGIALSSAVFPGVLDGATCWGIGVGVFVGGILGALGGGKICARRFTHGLGVFAGLILFFGVSFWRNLFLFAGVSVAHGLAWAVAAAGFVAAMEWVQKTGVFGRVFCVALFLFGCVRMLEPSNRGHLERPYWIVERVLEHNVSPEGLWALVACGVLTLALVLLKPRGGKNRAHGVGRRIAAGVLWVGFLSVLFLLPKPSKNPVLEPPPPRAPDAPPPPPPPQKIAAVEFAGFCRPSDFTDDAYLFHIQPRDSILPAEAVDPQEADSRRTRVKTRIFLFEKSDTVPALLGLQGGVALREFDRSRFEEAWEMEVLFPRDSVGKYERLVAPAGRDLSRVEEALWRGIFEEQEIRPEKAAAKIKAVLEKAGKLSERSLIPPEKWNLESFLFENTTGGSENFGRAAEDLLRMAGMEARSVRGLRYDPGGKAGFKFRELIVLNEAHFSTWVEWRMPGGEWHPLVIHPETVLDDKQQPPPEEDLENLLAREAGKTRTPPPVVSSEYNAPKAARIAGILLLVFCGVCLLVFLVEIWASDEPEVVVFRWMLAVLGRLGYRPMAGEGWAVFEQRLRKWSPAAEEQVRSVRCAVENLRWELKQARPSRGEVQVRFLQFVRGLVFRGRSRPSPEASQP